MFMFLNLKGEIPIFFLNILQKYEPDENPVGPETSSIDKSVVFKSPAVFSILLSFIYSPTVLFRLHIK